MGKVNVFGKSVDIEYDIGATQAVDSPVRQPTPIVTEQSDLSDQTLANVAEFTHEATNVNAFSVPEGGTKISLVDDKGIPSLPTDASNPGAFDSNFTGNKTYSNEQGATFFHKGIGSPATPNGNTLLAQKVQAVVSSFTSPVLKNNRFTPPASPNNPSNPPSMVMRVNPHKPLNTLGDYTAFRAANGKDFTEGDFANVGASLSLRATTTLGATGGYGSDGPDGAAATAASILPGLAQIGLSTVSPGDFDVSDVLNTLINANTSAASLDPNNSGNHTVLSISDSVGVMNNVLTPFQGLLPLGMLAMSIALVLALKLALEGILVIFTTITSAGASVSSYVGSDGRPVPGSYVVHSKVSTDIGGISVPIPLPAYLFGLHDTVHSYSDCVNQGMSDFFGGKITDVGSSLTRILESPGFYAVFCRVIVRSAAEIVAAIKNSIKGNPIQIAENIIALVDVIKYSKIVGALNMFATIGDASLNEQDLPAYKALSDKSQANTRLSTIDALTDDSSTGYKNRLNGKLQLAWSTRNSPSAFLIPDAFAKSLAAFSQLGDSSYNPAVLSGIESSLPVGWSHNAENRFDTEDIINLEATLDAEYMPFYFHDLRTNEIVSFPAFLTALTDDFSVNYESGDYYGRMDPVKIYKNTTRKISVGFNIVATSEADFDQMWVKINKLVTLVYPQWSQGTVLNNTDANVKMVQPFSQTPSASPLIRLRLGDLFRSNYSRFALARLFGLGSKNFNIDGNGDLSTIDPTSYYASINKMYVDAAAVLTAPKGLRFVLSPGQYGVGTTGGGTGGALGALAGAAVAAVTGGKTGPKPTFSIPQPVVVSFQGPASDDASFAIVDIVDSGVKNGLNVKDNQLKVPVSTLKLSMASDDFTANVNLYSVTPLVSQGSISALQSFFSPDNNTIVRSFEDVGGKGLACTIDSLNFGWLDNIPWETSTYGSRAPKMCRVTMNISPVHDIAPGIDSDGFNRAPIYGVGGVIRQFSGDANDTLGKGLTKFNGLYKKNLPTTQR